MTLSDLQLRIEKGKTKAVNGHPGVKGRCPNCAQYGRDRKGDHFIGWDSEDGWLHVSCIVGCSEVEILGALRWEESDRRTEPKESAASGAAKPAQPAYLYRGPEGSYVYHKQRYAQKDGGKGFTFEVREKEDGSPSEKIERTHEASGRKWMSWPKPSEAGLNGKADCLFYLPELLAAKNRIVLVINEGEKATKRCWGKGIPATNQPHGAGRGKWLPQYTAWIKGFEEYVIVADRDEAGDVYATDVFVLLRAAGYRARVVRSKTTNPSDDADDHFAAGFAIADFVPAPDLMPKSRIEVRSQPLAMEPVEVEYLVEPYLPKGKCVLFDADGGVGKTSMALAWAASLSLGLHPVTHESLPGGPVKTLMTHKDEDPEEELEAVFRANGGVPGYLFFTGREFMFDDSGLADLQAAILDVGAGFVIVDALFYFLHGIVKNTNETVDATFVMAKVRAISARTGAVFFDIRHTAKGVVGKEASNLGMGSVAFRNSHRGQLLARWHPTMKGVVVVTDEKGSLMTPRGPHFCFERRELEVYYRHDVPNPFDKPLDDSEKALTSPKTARAEQYLREVLTGQWVKQKEVYAALAAMGIGKNTAWAACKALGVSSKPLTGGGDWWLHLEGEKEEPYDEFAD